MRAGSTTTLFLSARTRTERQSMRLFGVRWAVPLRATHRAATRGIRSDFLQESQRIRCIYLKLPLIYCPMTPTSNARERITGKKTCSLCRACIRPKRNSRRAKSPLPYPLTCKKIRKSRPLSCTWITTGQADYVPPSLKNYCRKTIKSLTLRRQSARMSTIF